MEGELVHAVFMVMNSISMVVWGGGGGAST